VANAIVPVTFYATALILMSAAAREALEAIADRALISRMINDRDVSQAAVLTRRPAARTWMTMAGAETGTES
jgi:hypothetical protein